MIPELKIIDKKKIEFVLKNLKGKDRKFLNLFLKKEKNNYLIPVHTTISLFLFKNKINLLNYSALEKLSFSYYEKLKDFLLKERLLGAKEKKEFKDLLEEFILEFDKQLNFNFEEKNSHDYQKFITRFLFTAKDWACFLEQGLGKTKIIIDLLQNFLRVSAQKVLYLTPSFLTYSTYLEFKKWMKSEFFNFVSFISPELSSKEKEKLLISFFEERTSEILIVSYEYLRYFLKNILKLPTKFNEFRKTFPYFFDILVCDESHKLKNPQSLTHKYIRNISAFCKRTYLLTGTPILNKIEDIFYQYRIRHYFFFNESFLEQEPTLEEKTFNVFNKKITFVSSLEKEKEKFINEILKFSAFVLKKESIFELPQKEFTKVYVKIPANICERYEKIHFNLLDDIEKYFEGKLKITSIFSKIAKLHELCQGFLYTKNKNVYLSNFKAKKLIEILNYLNEFNEKKEKRAIIFFKYDYDRQIIENILKKYNISYKVVTNLSQKDLKKFLENLEKEDVRVLLIQIHKGSHGLNLQNFASNVIYYSYDFSFGDFSQSQDRIHRIGQDKTCHYFILISHHPEIETMDEIIYKKLLKKKEISRKALLKDLKNLKDKLIKEKENIWEKEKGG